MIRLKEILFEQEAPKKKKPDPTIKVTAQKKIIQQIANKVDALKLGSPIADFLVHVAAVESCYGLNPRAGKNVWQVDPIAFKDTQNIKSHPNLKEKYKILKKAGIDWPTKSYNDIKNNMLLNGIAARLYLANQPGSIPSDLKGQAQYWKSNYNTAAGAGAVNDFVIKNSNGGLKGCTGYVQS